MTEQKPRRKRRTKANIVASIDSAAVAEISQNGFVSSLVTNIIKNAQIEPQVFYNRYKDINDFYDAFVRKYDSLLEEVLKRTDYPVVSKQGVSSILRDILKLINSDPVPLELLRWELCDKNKTTVRTSLLRELNFQPLIQGFTRAFKGSDINIVGIFAILTAGVYYMSLHKKLAPFYGIDLNSKEGIGQVEGVIENIVALVFDAKKDVNHDREIADKLKALGVSKDIIRQALGDTVLMQDVDNVSVNDMHQEVNLQ